MSREVDVELPTRRATSSLARRIAPHGGPGDLLLLEGPLGAGKTFFARALLRARGLPSDERVTSPTFTLINEHPLTPPVAHADVYRLGSSEEVAALGLGALRREGWLVIVEWGGRYREIFGGDALVVEISAEPRRARVSATGPQARGWLERAFP